MIDTLLILSPGRSGSTLLSLILGSHPRSIALGEITQLPRDLAENDPCSCGTPLRQCVFWRAVIAQLEKRTGIDIWRGPYSLELGFIANPKKHHRPPLTAGYHRRWKLRHGVAYLSEVLNVRCPQVMQSRFALAVANTLSLYEAVRAAGAGPLVVDSSKAYLKSLALYRRIPERARLVLLTRDGRATFSSRLRNGNDRRRSMLTWRNFYAHALPLIQRNVPSEHVCYVRYEELASDPATQTQRICEFAGLTYDPTMLDIRAKVHHVASGNDMRLKSESRIRPGISWQLEMRQEDLRFFDLHAGAVNRKLGYS